ncbi:MAG: WbqC family protein [Chryseolinea sp.]
MSLLIELHYLPSIAYFAALEKHEEMVIEKHEHYRKQSFRNRCQIVTSQGLRPLIVPTLDGHGKVPITEVRIDYSQKWLNNHWRSIQSSYGKAPFFEYYSDELHDTLYEKHILLYDLNRCLLSMCLRWIRKTIRVNESLTYEKSVDSKISDARSLITVKNNGKEHHFYKPVSYTQVFGSAFVEDVSVIDLIFCVGPDAAGIVKASSIVK